MTERKGARHDQDEGFQIVAEDPYIHFLTKIIRFAVKILAGIMTLIILWGILDIFWVLYERLLKPPLFLLNISDILATFGAFLAVLIAIEIFVNVTIYLRDDVIHVKLVVATALMAIARKVIVFDYNELSAQFIWATAPVILALGITYWLTSRKPGE
ncbi:MAG: phosphate-starvation-inducible PsiE family protein [Desulfatiglandaceae bacterium]